MATFIVMATSVFSFDRPALTDPGQSPPRTAMPKIETQDEAIAIALQVAPVARSPQKPAAAARNPIVDTAQITEPTTAPAWGASRSNGPDLGRPPATFLKPRLSARSEESATA